MWRMRVSSLPNLEYRISLLKDSAEEDRKSYATQKPMSKSKTGSNPDPSSWQSHYEMNFLVSGKAPSQAKEKYVVETALRPTYKII